MSPERAALTGFPQVTHNVVVVVCVCARACARPQVLCLEGLVAVLGVVLASRIGTLRPPLTTDVRIAVVFFLEPWK